MNGRGKDGGGATYIEHQQDSYTSHNKYPSDPSYTPLHSSSLTTDNSHCCSRIFASLGLGRIDAFPWSGGAAILQ